MTVNLVQFPDFYDKDITVQIVNRIGEMAGAWREYFDVRPTAEYQTKTAGVSGFGRMGQWKDDEPLPLDDPSDIYDNTITQSFYGMGFAISRKAAQYGTLKAKIPDLVDALVDSLEDLYSYTHASILNNAFTTTYSSLGSIALISASHTTEGGGTASNIESSAALTPANLEVLIVQGLNMVNFRGIRQKVRYTKLIVPPALRRTATKILQSEGESGTTDNDINTQRGMMRIIVEPYLTDGSTTQYFLQAEKHGLKSLHGQGPTPERIEDGPAKRLVHGLSADFGTGVETWYGMAGSQGA